MERQSTNQKFLHWSERFLPSSELVCNCYCTCAGDEHSGRSRFPNAHDFRHRFLRNVKRILILLAVIAVLLACESVNYVPPVTQQMAAAKKGRRVNFATLREGRTLLVHRCIECHTLPPL